MNAGDKNQHHNTMSHMHNAEQFLCNVSKNSLETICMLDKCLQ